MLPPETARTGAVAFEDRNRRRLPIEGSLGAAVTPISATLIDGLAASVLLREHPPGSVIVAFSVPTYPAPRMAVIAYRAREGDASAARLESIRGIAGWSWRRVEAGLKTRGHVCRKAGRLTAARPELPAGGAEAPPDPLR